MFSRHTPVENEELKHQTELSSITDEEFARGFEVLKATPMDRAFQILQFIFGFGWLRLILLGFFLCTLVISLIPLYLAHFFTKNLKSLLNFSILSARFHIRAICFCLGVTRIRVHGKRSESARVFIFNHTSVLDGPLIYILQPFTVVSMAGVKKVPFFGKVLGIAGTIYIDRTKSSGNSKTIINSITDHSKLPVALSPEGKTTHGKFLLKFRTGGFLTDEEVQPITIRYTHYFSEGKCSHRWLVGGFKEWFWRCLCIPFGIVDIDFLAPLPKEEVKEMTPQERALKHQLLFANFLGIKAIDRSSAEIFKKKAE